MQKYKMIPPMFAQQGVSLIETLVAILIFSFGVLALVGLQATMIKNTSGSKYRTDASFIAQQKIGEIWADAGNVNNAVSNKDISALLPGGRLTATMTGNVYQITVGWTEPGETAATSATAAPCFMLVAHCFTTTASVAGAI